MFEQLFEFLDLSVLAICLMLLAAFATAVLHGATGMAGGIVLTALLSTAMCVKDVIPIVTCALVLSHASRTFLYLQHTDWSSVKTALLFGMPTVALGALTFKYLSAYMVAMVMALVLAASFPVKRFAQRRQMKTTKPVLAVGSSVWGFLAGNVIGPGFFLAPFLLGTGMNRLSFVGTLAVIVLAMNVVKVAVFSAAGVIDMRLFVLGVLIGLVTIPGNWLGREMLKNSNDSKHRLLVDSMTVILIVYFVYLATSQS